MRNNLFERERERCDNNYRAEEPSHDCQRGLLESDHVDYVAAYLWTKEST